MTANDSLAHALLLHPLQVTLYKQGVPASSRRHPNKRALTGQTAVTTELVGSADVDLSPLLSGRWDPCVTLFDIDSNILG